MIEALLKRKYETPTTKIKSFKILDEDKLAKYIEVTLINYNVVYKVTLTDDKVYIGQTNDFISRMGRHKARFGKKFKSAEVIINDAKENDEIDQIAKYRNKLGIDNVVNISAGDKIIKVNNRNLTFTNWFEFTPVQRAIGALNHYEIEAKLGNKISMSEAAKTFASSKSAISKVLSLRKVAGDAVVQKLFSGDSIPIKKAKADGTVYSINSTSADAIRKYYEGMLLPTEGSRENAIDAIEMAWAQIAVTQLLDLMSYDGIGYLTTHLLNSRDMNKTSYAKDAMMKELDMAVTEEEE